MQRLTLLTERAGLNGKVMGFPERMLMYSETRIAAMTMAKTSLVQITIRMVCSLIGFK